MILTKLTLESFKRIKKAEIELGDVTVLVGANGSGKSSVIQAVHLACCVIRQADRVEMGRTSTVSVDQLDYLPTDYYMQLAHRSTWGNKAGTPASHASLTFFNGTSEVTATCSLRAARNAGISITGNVPAALIDRLRKRRSFFSAYIPGISGIPNREEKKSKKVVLRSCSYGDSNIILRNALLLLKQESAANIQKIEQWIGKVCGPINISVSHNEETDFSISCHATIDGVTRPLELIGTGYLQLIQLFAYVLLFKPGVLLVDEPDIHLHPTVQERLASVLAEVAQEYSLRILLTTHSPFIVRGASIGAKVYWLSDGRIESDDRFRVELLLGWGAFGKRILLYSEDSEIGWLKRLLRQWPHLEAMVAFFPGNGYAHVPTPKQAEMIASSFGGKYKVLIHRDRDSLTSDEAKGLVDQYRAVGAELWLPEMSDVESYFCLPEFLARHLTIQLHEADAALQGVLTKNAKTIHDQFASQRAAHNQELYKAGGSPSNLDVLAELSARPLKEAKGKFVFGQLKNAFKGNQLSERDFLSGNTDLGLATDLRKLLEGVLS